MKKLHQLTEEDVRRLKADRTARTRETTAAKVANQFSQGELSDSEREIAEEIFRFLVRDVAVKVREALCQHLKESRNVPHDVALALALDVESVALPMLESSVVLSDEDLIEIVRSQSPAKQKAVARREEVSEQVSEALIDTENEEVVTTLVENTNAEIGEQAMQKVVETFPDNEVVQGILVQRPELPISVAERLVGLVSYTMRQHLIDHYDFPIDETGDVVKQTRERATLSLIGTSDNLEKVRRLVRQLFANGHLTPSILLRSMSMGKLIFFEVAMAELAKVPIMTVRTLLYEKGSRGFSSIYQRAGLPSLLLPAFQAAVGAILKTESEGTRNDQSEVSRRVLWALRSQYPDYRSSNFEEILDKLTQLTRTPAPVGR
ncbi:MAG: DUF2336 domain-containing protein [Proteobacteria bacterium]|nr:DUF2336 domain-containing protein [Pseudomonadota bacterium]